MQSPMTNDNVRKKTAIIVRDALFLIIKLALTTKMLRSTPTATANTLKPVTKMNNAPGRKTVIQTAAISDQIRLRKANNISPS